MKTRALPIGIDLGTAAVRMAQLRRVDGQFELAATALTQGPGQYRDQFDADLSALADRLRRLLGKGGFRGRQCVLALPAEATFIQHVRIAKLPTEKLQHSLRRELEVGAPFDPSDAIIRHIVVGEIWNEGRAGQEVIVIAASRQTVETYLELARRSRLEVVAMSVAPCAVVECFAQLFRRARQDGRVSLFLNMGRTSTQVVIAHGARLAFARNLMLGCGDVDEALGTGLGTSAGQAGPARVWSAEDGEHFDQADPARETMDEAVGTLAEGITNCLRYHDSVFPARPVERALFLGGQAHDRRFCREIARRINLPGEIGDPLARIGRADGVGLDIGMDRRQAQPAWAVAVGLSIGAEMPNAA